MSRCTRRGSAFPPVKLYRRGELNRDVLDIMLLNVRMREQNWGDLKAEIAAMSTGERKVHEMIQRFGADVFREGIGRPPRLRRATGAQRDPHASPTASTSSPTTSTRTASTGYPCRIAVTLIVKDDELVLDFSESDPQLTSSINIPTGGDRAPCAASWCR